MDTQYMTIQNGKLISLYSNILFIFGSLRKSLEDEQHTKWCEKSSQKYRTTKSPDS